MLKKVFPVLVLFVCCHKLHAQTKSPEVYLNHLFIVLDTESYARVSDSNLITQKLGNLTERSVSTTSSGWSGKYLAGKNGYFEFFTLKSYEGAVPGDLGLGFMTQRPGDLLTIENNWKQHSRDPVGRDTSVRVVNGIKQSWYYSIYLASPDTLQPFATWVMENTPEELMSVGFTVEEAGKEMKWEEYVAKRNGKPFTKAFNRIKRLHVQLNSKNYQIMKRSLIGFGLQQKGNMFFNSQVAITYTIDEKFPVRLKTVEIELTETFEATKIAVSKHVSVDVKGDKAIWAFN